MTKDELEAIRVRLAAFTVQINDVSDLLAEVERLTAERDAAFQRGVAAMREAAASYLDREDHHYCADAIRELSDPEDK